MKVDKRGSCYLSCFVMITVYLFIAAILFIWISDFSTSTSKLIRKKNAVSSPQIKIGLVLNSLLEDRWQKERDFFVSSAKASGAEVYVKVGLNDSASQISQIRYLINKGIDVLVLIPQNSDELSEIVAEAHMKGIAVICYDSLVTNAHVDLYLTFDSEEIGRLQGENLLNASDKGEFIVLKSPSELNISSSINSGLKKSFASYLNCGYAEIVCEESIQDLNPSYAERLVSNSIIQHNNIKGIIAPNDTCAGEIIKLLSRKNMDNINVIGADADLIACKRIADGLQLGTIYKPFDKMARDAAEWSIKLAEIKSGTSKSAAFEKEYMAINTTTNNKNIDVPTLIYPVMYIDKRNVQNVLN